MDELAKAVFEVITDPPAQQAMAEIAHAGMEVIRGIFLTVGLVLGTMLAANLLGAGILISIRKYVL